MVTPVFQVADYAQALAFYIDWLGFSIDWEDRPASGGHYIQISRGDLILHLTTYPNVSCAGARALVEFSGLLAFHYLLLQKESVFSVPPLQKTTWNNKVLQLELFDPAGNCVVLTEVCL